VPTRIALCLTMLLLALSAFANTQVIPTGTSLDVRLDSDQAISMTSVGPTVRGALTVSPAPIRPACDRLAFLVDGEVRLSSTDREPRLVLDTTRLADGTHAVCLEAQRGGKPVLTTGEVTLHVANKGGSEVLAATDTAPEQPSPPYTKLYRASLTHEAIWFNGDPADLDRHGYLAGGRMYITLNDLLRHVGGRTVWGPKASYVEVRRNDVTVRVVPGSDKARVNGTTVSLGSPVVARKGLCYVPLRAMCKVFNVYVEWSDKESRAYVYAPQLSYSVTLRQYPWVDTTAGRAYLGDAPGRVSFHNYTGLPVHVRFEGNGYMSDWQIHAFQTLGPCPMPAGTYKTTVWSRQGEDFEAYLTVAAGVDDLYAINVHTISLEAH
jgi:hypothetical protein